MPFIKPREDILFWLKPLSTQAFTTKYKKLKGKEIPR